MARFRRIAKHHIEALASLDPTQRIALEHALALRDEGTKKEVVQLARDLLSVSHDLAVDIIGFVRLTELIPDLEED